MCLKKWKFVSESPSEPVHDLKVCHVFTFEISMLDKSFLIIETNLKILEIKLCCTLHR